jgi:small subunit ribosomal protein S20
VAKKKVSSAEKAHRQSIKRREHNRALRSRLRSALKGIRSALDQNDLEAARESLNQTVSLVDKMANKGIIHKNTAGRYKSRIVKRLGRTGSAG